MGDTPDPVVTVAEGGQQIVRPAEDAALLGARTVDQGGIEADARVERRRMMFDTTSDKITTFAEGVVDAMTMGLVRQTGETADLRRDVNSGSALAGNVLGFMVGMAGPGPVRGITQAAEGFGAATAKTLLRSGEGSLVARAAQEAAASAALAGGQAFGHQLMDTILEDKDFSSEAIIDEAKLGGLLGAAGGVVLGGLSKAAKLADVKGQGGLIGDFDEAIRPHREATRAYDAVMERHSTELGVLKQMEKDGLAPREMITPRDKALTRAEKARQRLDDINEQTALSGKNDHVYKKWQKASVEYRAAVTDLDAAMQEAVPMSAVRGDLDALDALTAKLPMRTDMPAELRFADTPPMGRPEAAPVEAPVAAGPDFTPPPDFGIPTRERGISALAPPEPGLPGRARLSGNKYAPTSLQTELPPPAAEFGIPTREQGFSSLRGQPEPAAPPAVETTKVIARPQARGATRELPVDPEMVGERRAILNANDLPDIYQPGGTHAGQPGDVTPAATPRGKTPPQPTDAVPDIFPPWEGPAMPQPSAKTRALDEAVAKSNAAMAELSAKAGGRLDSAGALGILQQAGIRPATDSVGAYMDQVYALRKAGHLSAAATRGQGGLKDALKAALAGVGGGVLGGPVGSAVAVGAELMYLKKGARIAAASGRLAAKVTAAAEKLLTSRRVRAVAAAVATNQPHAYSDKGPIADPVDRIQEIQFLAAHPDAIMERVAKSAQDLADQPELLKALQMRAVNQMQRLAVRAPAIFFTRLGQPMSPPAGALRTFFEYENALHDLQGVLDAIGNKSATRPQVDALRENFPSVHIKAAAALLMDPEKLQKASRETLRVVEMVTGMPLTGGADPMFIARQSEAWAPPAPQQPPSKPQAFNINPTGAPTPSQSSNGRAPGN